MGNNNEAQISNPTYMGHIRHFFDDIDITHMKSRGIELATYEGVKFNALRIYFRTKDQTMPPEPDRKWSKARVATFYNWMKNGYPRGTAEPQPVAELAIDSALRVRENIAGLLPPAVEKLKRAFRGLMQRDADDPQGYFSLAGLHWLPGPNFYCRHHENAYNPWHRIYLIEFENALRSVEGCKDVTLPYWDITEEKIPPVLNQDPFASYTIPQELCTLEGDCYPKGYVTKRYKTEKILSEIRSRGIPTNIAKAIGHPHWERFNGWDAGRTQEGIIRAHDNGHGACGPTLRNQDIAAFDPMFWFFHANWDRLWWKWQQDFGATTLNRFKSHVAGSVDWLDDPVLNGLPPFKQTTAQTIDLSHFDINYAHPAAEEPVATRIATDFGSLAASRSFGIKAGRIVSVRVKNIDRLQIPGSFDVSLHVGNKVIAKQAFFQSTTPKQCATCRKNAVVSFDFLVEQSELLNDKVQVSVELLREDELGGGISAVCLWRSHHKCSSSTRSLKFVWVTVRGLQKYPNAVLLIFYSLSTKTGLKSL